MLERSPVWLWRSSPRPIAATIAATVAATVASCKHGLRVCKNFAGTHAAFIEMHTTARRLPRSQRVTILKYGYDQYLAVIVVNYYILTVFSDFLLLLSLKSCSNTVFIARAAHCSWSPSERAKMHQFARKSKKNAVLPLVERGHLLPIVSPLHQG